MNTAPLVAVIGAPTLAKALADVGFRIATGADFRQAALAANTALQEAPQTVAVVDYTYADAAGFDAFVRALVARTRTVAVLTRSKHPLVGSVPGVMEVAAPTTVGELMVAIGYQKIDHPAGAVVIVDEDAVVPPVPAAILPLPLDPAPSPQAAVAADNASADDAAEDAALAARVEASNRAALERLGDTDDDAAGQADGADHASAGPEPHPEHSRGNSADEHLPDFVRDLLAGQAHSPTAPASSTLATSPPTPTPAPAAAAASPAFPTAAAVPAHVSAPDPTPLDTAPPQLAPVIPPSPDTMSELFAVDPVPPAPAAVPTPTPFVAPAAAATRPTGGVLVVVAAGSGGVGKTSTSIDLAKAASEAGLRAVVIDTDRGQSDVHQRLRVPQGATRTIYDIVTTGMPGAGLVRPDEYNQYRQSAGAEPLGFAAVFGPTAAAASSTPVYVYGQAIDYCVQNADITIVDTEILKANPSDLFTDILIPRLRSNGWLCAVYGQTSTSEANVFDRLNELVVRDNIPRSRILVVARDFETFPAAVKEDVERRIGSNGIFAGAVMHDPGYRSDMNMGRIRTDLPGVEPTIRHILHAVTGNPVFMPRPDQQRPARRGIMGWLRR